jgi:predicted ATPase
MGFAFSFENFGCLERVQWQPDGVCALVGPNGAGKSTLLQAVGFLGAFQREGLDAAALSVGSGTLGSLKRSGSLPSEWLRLRAELDGCAWEVRLAVANGMVEMPTAENVFVDGAPVLNQPHGASHVNYRDRAFARSPTNRHRSALALALESNPGDADPRLATLASRIAACRCYSYEHLAPLRRSGSNADAASELDPSGKNAFSVLRNWRAGSREHVERDRFVRDTLRDAFPETFADYDFVSAGPVVFARFYGPGSSDPTFPAATAHGVLVGMLHLAAIASAPDGSIVAIDEFENGLHPHAIRALLGAIRERAGARGLTVVLATHSPTLLNCFDAEPERVFVIERSPESQPRALTEVKKREWLAHFALGDLYSGERIGGPKAAA